MKHRAERPKHQKCQWEERERNKLFELTYWLPVWFNFPSLFVLSLLCVCVRSFSAVNTLFEWLSAHMIRYLWLFYAFSPRSFEYVRLPAVNTLALNPNSSIIIIIQAWEKEQTFSNQTIRTIYLNIKSTWKTLFINFVQIRKKLRNSIFLIQIFNKYKWRSESLKTDKANAHRYMTK